MLSRLSFAVLTEISFDYDGREGAIPTRSRPRSTLIADVETRRLSHVRFFSEPFRITLT